MARSYTETIRKLRRLAGSGDTAEAAAARQALESLAAKFPDEAAAAAMAETIADVETGIKGTISELEKALLGRCCKFMGCELYSYVNRRSKAIKRFLIRGPLSSASGVEALYAAMRAPYFAHLDLVAAGWRVGALPCDSDGDDDERPTKPITEEQKAALVSGFGAGLRNQPRNKLAAGDKL